MIEADDADAGPTRPDAAWARPWAAAAAALEVDNEVGLDDRAVEIRSQRFGANALREESRRSAWEILISQFRSLIVLLLAVAAGLSFAFGDWVEGGAVLVVIFINALIGFVTELRAVRSMEALKELSRVNAKVRRSGKARKVPAESLVPGDVLLLAGGDVVTADVRLIESSKLQVDESALTGESVPVDKQTEPVDDETPLAERASMAYKGTAVTRGAGEGIVVATGMATELGQISELVASAEQTATPLEERLEALGRKLIWVTLGIAAAVAIAGFVAGRELRLMLETAVALAVASVPEGLPIVATVALARGMARMARRNALINKLSAVETLGATSVILTDKTGTLTENRMTVVRLEFADATVDVSGRGLACEGSFTLHDDDTDADALDSARARRLRTMLEVGVLCTDASLPKQGEASSGSDGAPVGDPLEVALLVAGAKAGIRRPALLADQPEVREVAFDAETKMMATFHRRDGGLRVAVKGALEEVLDAASRQSTADGSAELDTESRQAWLDRNRELASDGLRVIALASKQTADGDADSGDLDPYSDLTLLGLVALQDPPREPVRRALQACKRAGIDVVMVTGDQPATARSVAHAVGLVASEEATVVHGPELQALDPEDAAKARIFARVSPAQKLDLIAVHQERGAVVAMTGDGVNDAPALKKADIGVAMGKRGTQVAREAADMVLKDDAFRTIAAAVEQGRAIFHNIRRFVLYLLSCNVAEILVVGLASVVSAPLPIRPLQILFLNLVTDVFPALALGMGEGDPNLMERPPRAQEEPVLTRQHWLQIGGYSGVITVAVLGALALGLSALGYESDRAVTLSFLTLAFAQLWHVFNMRDAESGLFTNSITRNPWVWGALGLCILILVAAVYVPFLSRLLRIVPPDPAGWGLTVGLSLVPLPGAQAAKWVWSRWGDRHAADAPPGRAH